MTSNKTIILNGEIIINPTIECLSTLDLPKEILDVLPLSSATDKRKAGKATKAESEE
jgi:hypothetical protein